MMPDGRRTALILSGGFAFGAYQVGVMLALFSGRCEHINRRPLAIDSLTGTSIGAVNAALLLSAGTNNLYRAAEFLRDVYLHELASSPDTCGRGAIRLRGNPANLFRPQCYRSGALVPLAEFADDTARIADDVLERSVEFVRSSAGFEQRFIRFVDLSVFTSTTRFAELLRRRIDPARVRACRTALQILASNWRTGDLRIFDPRELDDELLICAIEASAAVPGLVPPVVIDGEPYADGGLVMNTGLRPAIDAGADALHVVYMDTAVSNMPLAPRQGTADTIYRMLAINLASMLNRDIEIAGRINTAVAAAHGVETVPASGAEARNVAMGALLAQAKPDKPFRHIDIHRYRAAADLGGAAGWVSFDYHNLVTLIERGYRETVVHDCAASECILSGGGEAVHA